MIGKQFDVSRTYIFEATEDSRYFRNTFEWCGKGVAPKKESLTHVPFSDSYRDNFNENGIFYCRDIADLPKKQYDRLKLYGIKSMLQCMIQDNGVVKGYVVFHDCRANRFWTQEQIDALSFIAEIMSTFLLKKRAQDRALSAAESMADILDNHSSWICVIEPDTFNYCTSIKKRTASRLTQPLAHRATKCSFTGTPRAKTALSKAWAPG